MLNMASFGKAARCEPFHVSTPGQPVTWSVVEPGELPVPGGRVCACDPLVDFDALPFAFVCAPGSYPVRLYLARIGSDERIAYAALWFSSMEVVSWESAVPEWQDPKALRPGEIFGYGVDSGTGCFQTPESLALLNARIDREPEYFEEIIAAMDETYVHTRSWARIQPEPSRALSFLVFSSGYGDGYYESYLGRDASGAPVCLVTDFGVVDIEAPDVAPSTRSPTWWEFWRR